jgi:plasmid stabilization system protein ParE
MLGSQQSTAEDADIDVSDTFDVSSTQATLYEPTRHIQDTVKADLELIATYLAKERAPSPVQAALSQVQNTYSRRVVRANKNSTEQAIRQLQATVQQLVTKVRDTPNRPTGPSPVSYAEAAKLGLPT